MNRARLLQRLSAWLRPKALRRTMFALPLLLAVLAALSIEAPRTMVYFSGKTEIVTLTVKDPQRALVQLPVALNVDTQVCHKGLALRPAAGSVLRYERPRGSALVVIVDAAVNTEIVADDQRRLITKPELLRFRVWREQAGCALASRVRLPANGLLTVGLQYSKSPRVDEPVPLVLLSGKLQVYGRAISSLLWAPLSMTPFSPAALYPVQDIQIPAGSEINRALAEEHKNGSTDDVTVWTGFVDLNEADRAEALDVEATSNARAVEVFLPSPRTLRGVGGVEPDLISLTLGARLLGDPNLRWLLGMLTLLLLLEPGLRSVFHRLRIRRRGLAGRSRR